MISLRSLSALIAATWFLGLGGCKPDSAAPEVPPAESTATVQDQQPEKPEHSHGSGPHGGTIADWGAGMYHVELTIDHDRQEATVYVLGPDEKTPAPIAAESIELSIQEPSMQVTLTPAPQQGDGPGMASRFTGNHEKLAVVQEYAGTILGVVDETPYSGDFQEVAEVE